MKTTDNIETSLMGGRPCRVFGAPDAPTVMIQFTHEQGLERMDREWAYIREEAPEQAAQACLIGIAVDDWNRDLSPWEAPPAFGDEPFGGNGRATLDLIQMSLLPALGDLTGRTLLLGGYSLAGLFALWAAYELPVFDGIAAVSPSMWFPGWADYAAARPIRADRVYLSLGKKEPKTRNPVMKTVGDDICSEEERLTQGGIDCILEWNPGTHFTEPDRRTARGFAWLLKKGARI